MAKKAVSFTSDLIIPAEHAETRKFKTWPRRAIKNDKYSEAVASARSRSKSGSNLESVILDLYYRFRRLCDVDVEDCLHYILSGQCSNALVAYSVLNTILKTTTTSTDSDDEFIENEAHLDSELACTILSRACSDLDAYIVSENVLDTRVLQQIMRVAEALWSKNYIPKTAVSGRHFAQFAERCVNLVRSRPGSKLLLSPAVRICNIALDESLLTASQTREFVTALARTHFLFAASFSAEVMLVLNTVQRVTPETLKETAEIWVPLAVRALITNSSLTRTLALHLLTTSEAKLSGVASQALADPTEPSKPESEPLVKLMVRKFAMMLSTSPSQDDLRLIIDSWILILESASHTRSAWPFLEHWIDLEKMMCKSAAKTFVGAAWNTLLAIQCSHPSYSRTLLIPLLSLPATATTNSDQFSQPRLQNEALNAVNCENISIWSNFLAPLFKNLGQRKGSEILAAWAGLAPVMPWTEHNVASYLDLFSLLMKNCGESQPLTSIEPIWSKIVLCCSKSRTRAMELVRFHYHMMSPENTNNNCSVTTSMALTDAILKTWSLEFLIERPKPNSFSLLTLVLLPIVVFVSQDKQMEYMDRLLANAKSESGLRSMLSALLHTVHTGSDNQLAKWMVASMCVREYAGSSNDAASGAVVSETLLTFLPLANLAITSHWSEWTRLFNAGTAGRARVLAKINELNATGLTFLLMQVSGYLNEKQRIIVASLTVGAASETLIQVVKDSSLNSEVLDGVARDLVATKKIEAIRCASEFVSASRMFVVAKPLLATIDECKATELVELWNLKVAPALSKCPAFVSKSAAAKLARDLPKLNIPSALVMPSQSIGTPTKRPSMDTPPSSASATSAKRSKRAILTGSVPPSLSTPPVSSDPPEEAANSSGGISSSAGLDDVLCSSPPQRSRSPRYGAGSMQSSSSILNNSNWRNSQQERARALKRVMMGLEMDEAVQDMKRSEQEMIYNLMFRSCVKLRTHLAATGPVLPPTDIENAKESLESTIRQRESLIAAEQLLIENGKRRALEGGSADHPMMSDEDSDMDDIEDDDDEYIDTQAIKLEV